MSYEDLSDDTALAVEPKQDKTAATIRRDIAQVESTLTEFDKVAAGLEVLRKLFPVDLVYDVSTTRGMTEAKAHRAAWRDPRITVEKFRKAGKAPVLALGKNIDARASWLTEQLLLGEVPVDEQIKAEEARQAQVKADKEAAEFGRILAMQEAVAEIAMQAMINGLGSEVIAARLADMRALAIDPKVFQEMVPQAEAARAAAIVKLEQAVKAAQWDEAEAKRKADEAARQRAEQAAADAERARVSAAQAEEAKRLQEARDLIAKAEREAAAGIEAERKKFEQEKAAWQAQQAAAVPVVQPRIGKDEAAVARGAAVSVTKDVGIDQIAARLGFELTPVFIMETLGVGPCDNGRLDMGWSERGFQTICERLQWHVAAVAVQGEALAA